MVGEAKKGIGHGRGALIYGFLLGIVLLFIAPGIKLRLLGMCRLFTEPVQLCSRGFSRAARVLWGGGEEEEDTGQLRIQLAEAKAAYENLKESTLRLSDENKQLRNRIGMTLYGENLSLSLCEVIKRDAFSQYYDYVLVNRGSSDGVRNGCLVLSDAGLVGVVEEAGMKTSKVLLATSERFSYPCQVHGRNVSGIIAGGGRDGKYKISMLQPVPQIVVNQLDGVLFDRIVVGDTVTVTPDGSTQGTALVVGKVVEVDSTTGPAPVLYLLPASSFAQMKYLFIVVGSK